MKTALVCIAKDEDNYIDEWIKYHTKLGFDFVYVYQNCWRYKGDKTQFNNVHWIEFDGDAKQLEAYHNFLKHQSYQYDWAAFFDVDEYLCLKKHPDVKTFLAEYADYCAVGVNWRMFGNSGQARVYNENYSLLKRFIMAEYVQNQHIKTILNTAKTKDMVLEFCDPHSINESLHNDFTINTKKSGYIHGPFNTLFDETVQLNHYYSKTLDEYLLNKKVRGRCDLLSEQRNGQYDIQKFSEFNKNDIEDLTARDFYFN